MVPAIVVVGGGVVEHEVGAVRQGEGWRTGFDKTAVEEIGSSGKQCLAGNIPLVEVA